MHYFTKERAEQLAKLERHWRVRKCKTHGNPYYDNLYMVWSDESDHYVEFDNLDGWINRLGQDEQAANDYVDPVFHEQWCEDDARRRS